MHWITCISLRLDVYIHMYLTRQTKKTFVDEDINLIMYMWYRIKMVNTVNEICREQKKNTSLSSVHKLGNGSFVKSR